MNYPQVIKFSNELVRPAMLKMAKLHQELRYLLSVYDAYGLEAKLAADTTFSDYLEDGSPADGRPPISAGGLRLAMENIRQFLASLEAKDPNNPAQITFLEGVYAMSPFRPLEL